MRIIYAKNYNEVRQTVQNVKRFICTERGCYALAPAV